MAAGEKEEKKLIKVYNKYWTWKLQLLMTEWQCILPGIIHREASGTEVHKSVGICFARGSHEIAKRSVILLWSYFFLSVWYPELPSNDVATKLQLTSFSLTSRLSRCIFRFPGNTSMEPVDVKEHRPIRLTQCCTQFKPFIFFKCEFHLIMQIQCTKNLNPERSELGTTSR